MNENSYIFVTPKIEQFVINSGDDYTANLAVNNAFFTSCRRKNKISIWKNKTSIKVEILFFYKA